MVYDIGKAHEGLVLVHAIAMCYILDPWDEIQITESIRVILSVAIARKYVVAL